MTNPKQEWQEEFMKEFGGYNKFLIERIESHISSLLLSNNKRLAEKVRGMKVENERDLVSQEELGEMVDMDGITATGYELNKWKKHHNQALEQAASIIEKE